MSKKDEALKLAEDALKRVRTQDMELVQLSMIALAAIREALAEQPAQQEPVAWGVDWGKAGDIPCVSIIKRLPGGGIEVMAVEYAPYSYTSPPAQRKPLTDEEIEAMSNDFEEGYVFLYRSFARAIEAAHGIKGDA